MESTSILAPIVEKEYTTTSREMHDIIRERIRMLQFDARVTVKKYDEVAGNREAEFNWSEETAIEIEEHLEFALEKLQVLIRDNDEVYVFTISKLERVD